MKTEAKIGAAQALVEHLLRLENDSLLDAHPEWAELIAEARTVSEQTTPQVGDTVIWHSQHSGEDTPMNLRGRIGDNVVLYNPKTGMQVQVPEGHIRKVEKTTGLAEATIIERDEVLHLQSLVAQGVAGETQRAAKARRYEDRNLGRLVAQDAERKKAVLVALDEKLDTIMEAVLA